MFEYPPASMCIPFHSYPHLGILLFDVEDYGGFAVAISFIPIHPPTSCEHRECTVWFRTSIDTQRIDVAEWVHVLAIVIAPTTQSLSIYVLLPLHLFALCCVCLFA
jgi:hypothetical protein